MLRLDTDLYESALHELTYLYPRLVPGLDATDRCGLPVRATGRASAVRSRTISRQSQEVACLAQLRSRLSYPATDPDRRGPVSVIAVKEWWK